MMTTCLSDHEQNQPLKNQVIADLLKEVREKTRENWQVIEIEHISKPGWFKEAVRTYNYELYLEIGGCLPFCVINFYRSDTSWTINPRNGAELIVAYLYGILSGLNYKKEDQ